MVRKIIGNYKELIELIPKIYYNTIKGYVRYKNNHKYTIEQIRDKIILCRDQFEIFRGRWTLEILYAIQLLKKCNFNELLNDILPSINSTTLSIRLRLLEKKNIIERNVITESPIRVQYKLTEFGEQAMTLLFPFVLFSMIPKNIRKKHIQFPTIKNLSREDLYQLIDEFKETKSNDNIQSLT